jgi:hypothetical protein
MKRLFGIGGEKAPTKTLDEVSETMDARGQHIDTKVKAIDHELLDLKKQMAVAKGPGLARLKQRAMMLLKQRKMLDAQCVPTHRFFPIPLTPPPPPTSQIQPTAAAIVQHPTGSFPTPAGKVHGRDGGGDEGGAAADEEGHEAAA